MKMSIILELNATELSSVREVYKMLGQHVPNIDLNVKTVSKYEMMLVKMKLRDTLRVEINQELSEEVILELQKLATAAVPAVKAALPLLEFISSSLKGAVKDFVAFQKKVSSAKKSVLVKTDIGE